MYLKSAVLYQECDMTCKKNVDNWMSKLATSSNIKYNMESGGHSRTGKRVSLTRWYTIMPVQTKKADQKRLLKKVQDKNSYKGRLIQ